MAPVQLSRTEKTQMAYWLARRAQAGGWFFIGLAGFALLITIFGTLRHPPAEPVSAETIIPFATFILVLVGAGAWLLRRRRVMQRWLDEPLYTGNGRIEALRQVPYTGYRMRLQVQTDQGDFSAEMGYLGRPDWQVGDDLELIVWEIGRFCPRHIDHIVDFGYLPTPERRRFVRRRVIGISVTFAIFVALAIVLGLYGQGRL